MAINKIDQIGSSDQKFNYGGALYHYTQLTVQGSALLSNLADGWHNITVVGGVSFGLEPILFGVAASNNISLLSPENKTYSCSSVPLTSTTFDLLSYFNTFKYRLDGQNNASIYGGNGTLQDLADGAHTLTIYAEHVDYSIEKGFYIALSSSSEVNFAINTVTPSPTPTSTLPPTVTPTATPTPEQTQTPTPNPTIEPTNSATPQPTASTSVSPSPTSSSTPEFLSQTSLILIAALSAFLIAAAAAIAVLERKTRRQAV